MYKSLKMTSFLNLNNKSLKHSSEFELRRSTELCYLYCAFTLNINKTMAITEPQNKHIIAEGHGILLWGFHSCQMTESPHVHVNCSRSLSNLCSWRALWGNVNVMWRFWPWPWWSTWVTCFVAHSSEQRSSYRNWLLRCGLSCRNFLWPEAEKMKNRRKENLVCVRCEMSSC